MYEKKTTSSINLRMIIASTFISLMFFGILIITTYRSDSGDIGSTVYYSSNLPESIQAYRGNIYDANGIELTKNIPRLKLSFIPKKINDSENATNILRMIEEVTQIPYSKIETLLNNGINSNDPSRPITLIDELAIQEAIKY
ncbi:MAG: hypothetical protein CL872_03615, partial [Dehalococcoidaceae bacterium]|nr:hypothetical protein [Dehalococcoidaceae bacterium]